MGNSQFLLLMILMLYNLTMERNPTTNKSVHNVRINPLVINN
jgi:hypothetical protein